MKDEAFIDSRLEPNFNVCFAAKEIRSRLGEHNEASGSLTESLEAYCFVDPESGIDQTRFSNTALMKS